MAREKIRSQSPKTEKGGDPEGPPPDPLAA
jgi:hypothetical protein